MFFFSFFIGTFLVLVLFTMAWFCAVFPISSEVAECGHHSFAISIHTGTLGA